MERNGWVEFGFDFYFDLFRLSYSFVVSWWQGLPCRWFYKGSYSQAMGCISDWLVCDGYRFPGLFVQIFASSIYRDWLVWQSILGSELARCVCMLLDGVVCVLKLCLVVPTDNLTLYAKI